MKLKVLSSRAAGICLVGIAGTFSLCADTFSLGNSAAGVQTPDAAITTHYETFDTASLSAGTFTTNFGGTGVTGVYSGSLSIVPADEYGGAGETGNYADALTDSSYTLNLSSNVNYFGALISSLDPGNLLWFYKDDTLLFNASPDSLISVLGDCPGSAYCGNPSNSAGPNQQNAFVNFYDIDGTFNKIVFGETGAGGGFETDNQAVATLESAPDGTLFPGAPEPASVGLMLIGAAAMAAAFRRKSSMRIK